METVNDARTGKQHEAQLVPRGAGAIVIHTTYFKSGDVAMFRGCKPIVKPLHSIRPHLPGPEVCDDLRLKRLPPFEGAELPRFEDFGTHALQRRTPVHPVTNNGRSERGTAFIQGDSDRQGYCKAQMLRCCV